MRLLVANHTAEIVGGAEQYLSQVVPALERAGYSVGLLTEASSHSPGSRSAWVAGGPGVKEEIERWAPEAVFVHGLFDSKLETWLVDRFPSVLFAHNYYGTCISGEKRHRRPVLQFCQRRFGKACLALYFPLGCGPASVRGFVDGYTAQRRRFDLLDRYREVVVGSSHMKAEFERNTRCQVTVAPLFSDSAAVRPSVAREPNRFVFVGRMTVVKGGDLAIEAVARLQAAIGDAVSLDLVGDGPERNAWEQLAIRCGVAANFHGWLGAHARDDIVQRACALILPSVWPEPFGLVGLEAGRLGVPTVAYEAGGVKDWLTDGVTGALCATDGDLVTSLQSGLQRAREDLLSRQRWGYEAHQRSQRFPIEEHVRVLLDVFARISEAAH
jgi:glycosyltransferase involved in cell wall biosynthesis